VNDFLFFRIENESVQCILLLYIISCVFGISGGNFIFSLTIAICVFAITWGLNQHDMIGGGDVKLLFPLILFAENNLCSFLIGVSISASVVIDLRVFWKTHIRS
jgi:Flp pilus assembly protein protease CpaA